MNDKIYPSMVIRSQAEAIELLEKENKGLKEKIEMYENPEDLTLMFMYCEEKAKDKIKQLQSVIKEIRTIVYEIDDSRKETGGYPSHYIDNLLQVLDKGDK